MYAVAERTYAEIGERHGYSGLLHGVAAVITELGGLDVTWQELSDRWHNCLVEYHTSMDDAMFTYERIAAAFDGWPYTSSPDDGDRLPFPFQDVYEGRSIYSLEAPDMYREIQKLVWIEREFTDHLKKEKIRRGTKRYNELLVKQAPKVIDAAINNMRELMKNAAGKARKSLEETSKLLNKAHATLEARHRQEDVITAAVRAAGAKPTEKYAAQRAARMTAWEQVAEKLGSHVQYLANAAEDLDAGKEAEEKAILWLVENKTLRPFLDAAGIAYELPSWMR